MKDFPAGGFRVFPSSLFAMRKFFRVERLEKSLQTPQGKLITIAASFAVFIAAFIFLYPWLGLSVMAVGILPLILGAWFYGVWTGLVFALALYIANLLLPILLGEKNIWAVLPGALLGLALGAAVSIIVGRMGKKQRKNQAEPRERTLLLEGENDHSRFLALLNDISLSATEESDLSSTLEVLAERIGSLFSADHCYVTFWGEKLGAVIPVAAHSSSREAFFSNLRQSSSMDLTLTAVALDTGQSVVVEDIQHSDRFSGNVADGYPALSMLGLPMMSGDRKLGAIIVGYDKRHHFSEEEIEYGELAARLISQSVAKVLLLDEARQRLHELAGLHNIAQTFSLRGDPRQTFGLLSKTLAGLMNAKKCFIGLYHPVTRKLRLQTPAYGLDQNQVASIVHFFSETSLRMLEDSNFEIVRANSEAEIPAEVFPLAHSAEVESLLIAPLLDAEKHPLGAVFAADKPGGFTGDDVRLLEVLAGQVTAVAQNVRLLNAERTRAGQLAVLHSIAVAINRVDNEDQLIENVTLIIGQKLYSDSFGILLLDETTQELYPHPSYRIGSHETLLRVPLGMGVAGTVAKSGKSRRINDAATLPEHPTLSPDTRSALCVPLKVGEKLLGVVNVESTKAGIFAWEDEELLTIIAGQLAMAIQRLRALQAERYQTQQLERSNSLIRALAEVNTRASAASDPDGLLQTLGNELTSLGLRCAVALTDVENQFIVLRYLSVPKRLIGMLERIGKVKIQDYALPIEKLSPYSDLVQHASLVHNPLTTITAWVPDIPLPMVVKVLKLIGITSTTSVCNLPLIFEGKAIGILWLWGEALKESDLNAVSLFASQVAAALQNANLLTEVGRLAITDDLTGIFNRRHFFAVAEVKFAAAQKSGSPLSALVVDLDHFKQINDSYGHGVGDQVLRGVAYLMNAAMRERDVIGRYGGEEFSILLPDTGVEAAANVAERLLASVSGVSVETDAGNLSVELSIGVAGTSKETPTLHSLILRADQAMYLAKSAGRNCVAVK